MEQFDIPEGATSDTIFDWMKESKTPFAICQLENPKILRVFITMPNIDRGLWIDLTNEEAETFSTAIIQCAARNKRILANKEE